ncbi:MAG: hypothetical protein IJN39_00370 [Clostridia bacterium]|nr:hypothetical protein [Clostridia bacterium]
MRNKAVYKPKSGVYRKILQITQSVMYTPQKEEWFIEKFTEFDAEKIKEALVFLCHTRYLCRMDDGTYAHDYDFRLKIRGVYHKDEKGGHIHPETATKLFRTVKVPDGWNLDAQHNDIVEVALEGELSDFDEIIDGRILGSVNGVIEQSGEYFVGTQHKIDGKWFVLPKDRSFGESIMVEGRVLCEKSGITVFAKLNYNRNFGKINGDASNLHENDCEEVNIPVTCTIIKVLETQEECFLYKFGLYPEMGELAQKEFLAPVKKVGKPYTRLDLTNAPSTFLSEQCAVNIEKTNEEYNIMLHVADLTDWFMPNSASESEILRKCAGNELLPDCLKERVKFSDGKVQNALTVSFKTDKCGNVFNSKILRTRIITNKTENKFYKEAVKALPKNGISSNAVICAANDAAALWFDENNVPAPFTHVVFSEIADELLCVAQKLGWCKNTEKTLANVYEILKTAKKQDKYKEAVNLVRELIDTESEAYAEDSMTVDFCSPFENYISILAQHSFAKSRNMRTNDSKNAHLKYVFEKVAIYNYRRKYVKYYETICSNLESAKVLENEEKAIGYYIAKVNKDTALAFVNGNFGLFKCHEKYKAGDEILLYYDDISLDCMNLLYRKDLQKKGN